MKRYLTTQEAGAILGVNASRVRQLIGAGRLKAEKLGHAWLILPRDLKAVRDRKPGRPWHKGRRHAKA